MVQLFMILVTYILVREIKIWDIYVGSGFLTYRKMVFRNFLVNLLSIGAFRGTRVVIWIFNILFLILLAKVYKKEYNINCIKSAFLFVMTTKYLSLICDIIIPRILFIMWKKDSLSSDIVYLVIMIKKENDERAKQDLMNSKLKLQEEYYSSLEESQMSSYYD